MSWLGFSTAAGASSAYSNLLVTGKESQTNTGAGPAFPNPVGLRKGPQGTVVWDGRVLMLLASSSLPVLTVHGLLCAYSCWELGLESSTLCSNQLLLHSYLNTGRSFPFST